MKKMKNNFQYKKIRKLLIGVFSFLPICLFAQEPATMKLNFTIEDSVKVCKVTVSAKDKPVEGADVKFYVKRFFGSLPLIPKGKAVATDDKGEARVNFPVGLPGDVNGTVVVIAKIEDNETYGTIEAQDSVKWGTIISKADQEDLWNERSLSGTGSKAPIYLIATAGIIILGIWGALMYVIFSLVRIKRVGIKKK